MGLQGIAERIKQHELALLRTDWKTNPALLDDLLSADFEEINSNGQVTTRHEVIQWLLHKDNDIEWSLMDFRIKMLSGDCVLANYIAQKCNSPYSTGSGSIRTSIWQRQGSDWKMIFHQATRRVET